MCKVCRPHRIAIAHGAAKRREITVGCHFLSQHPSPAGQKTNALSSTRTHVARMPLYHVAGVFKTQNCRGLWSRGHAADDSSRWLMAGGRQLIATPSSYQQ